MSAELRRGSGGPVKSGSGSAAEWPHIEVALLLARPPLEHWLRAVRHLSTWPAQRKKKVKSGSSRRWRAGARGWTDFCWGAGRSPARKEKGRRLWRSL